MSFNFNQTKEQTQEVINELRADASLPEPIKSFVIAGVEALRHQYGPESPVKVTCYGHLHDGQPGNYNVTSATVTVEPIVGLAAA